MRESDDKVDKISKGAFVAAAKNIFKKRNQSILIDNFDRLSIRLMIHLERVLCIEIKRRTLCGSVALLKKEMNGITQQSGLTMKRNDGNERACVKSNLYS